jgi:hypothetical protein
MGRYRAHHIEDLPDDVRARIERIAAADQPGFEPTPEEVAEALALLDAPRQSRQLDLRFAADDRRKVRAMSQGEPMK